MQLNEYTLFANRYQLEHLLGRGGFSEVWLATDTLTNLRVAVKVYAPGQGMDQDGLKDFSKELTNVYNLNHTNLLKPQHVDAWENMPYLIMPFCEQGSCLKKVGKMKEDELWQLIHDVASGLAYLHDQDIIHQDIKPDNILIDSKGNYVITDFGISVQTRSTLRKSMNVANASGTTAYMAPERFSAEPTPVKASDIWSLGATVYELLTGRTPFGEIGGGLQKGGADLPTIHAELSPTLRQVITLMLAPEPWDRPSAKVLMNWAENPEAVQIALRNVKYTGNRMGGSSSLLKISPDTFVVEPVGGEQKVSITTKDKWIFMTDDAKWYTADKADDNTLLIKYSPNETGEERSSQITITAGAQGAIVTLYQKSLPKRSKKTLYASLSAVGVLLVAILIIGFVQYSKYMHHVHETEEAHKVAVEKTNRSIKLMKLDFPASIMDPLMDENLLSLERTEQSDYFDKTMRKAQLGKLKALYIDSLGSIQRQLEEKIEYDRQLRQKWGLEDLPETDPMNRLKMIVDDNLNMLNEGYSIEQINTKRQEALNKIAKQNK
ncbi:MAG: protein kinase [Paludibacteraceae bacterium]|nr:protein kinase [Paludibacteraceae bacterium]